MSESVRRTEASSIAAVPALASGPLGTIDGASATSAGASRSAAEDKRMFLTQPASHGWQETLLHEEQASDDMLDEDGGGTHHEVDLEPDYDEPVAAGDVFDEVYDEGDQIEPLEDSPEEEDGDDEDSDLSEMIEKKLAEMITDDMDESERADLRMELRMALFTDAVYDVCGIEMVDEATPSACDAEVAPRAGPAGAAVDAGLSTSAVDTAQAQQAVSSASGSAAPASAPGATAPADDDVWGEASPAVSSSFDDDHSRSNDSDAVSVPMPERQITTSTTSGAGGDDNQDAPPGHDDEQQQTEQLPAQEQYSPDQAAAHSQEEDPHAGQPQQVSSQASQASQLGEERAHVMSFDDSEW